MKYVYNELKLEILLEIETMEEAIAGDIAENLGRTQASIGMSLLSYHRHGLLNRYTTNWKNEKVYSLSDRGRERLEWLLECAR